MSGVAIEISFDTRGATAAYTALREASADLKPALHDIGAGLESSTVNRFETNIAPDGTPWRQSLHSKVTGMPTLVAEGHLRDSVHYQLDGDHVVEVGAGGIAADYAAVHQVGATIEAKAGGALSFRLATGQFIHRKSVTIPARPYLGISADDGEEIVDTLVDHWRLAVVRGLG